MSTPDPVDWEGCEDALFAWISQVTDIPGTRIRTLRNRDEGEARGPEPKATIQLLSIVPTMQVGTQLQRRVMRQRYTVTANGPGEVGVDFYPGQSLAPQRISILAGVGDPPATSAAALLLQLQADLPAGYTASADPMDTASVLVDGSDDEPEFASAPADAALLTVTDAIPRTIKIYVKEHFVVWRVTFRTTDVSGAGMASNQMAKAMTYRRSRLDPAMRALSFRPAGTALSQVFTPQDRRESIATLDVRFLGQMTGAEAATAMRATKIDAGIAA